MPVQLNSIASVHFGELGSGHSTDANGYVTICTKGNCTQAQLRLPSVSTAQWHSGGEGNHRSRRVGRGWLFDIFTLTISF